MKKYILSLIAMAAGLLVFGSCDKFLDTENLTKKDTSNFPVNETDAVQMVNGIYALMNARLSEPERDPFYIFDIASDDRLGGGSQSNVGAQAADRLMSSASDFLKETWQYCYAGINRANSALETIDNVTTWSTATKKDQLLCEIHFMRAFYYLNLVQVFGSVPLVVTTEPLNLPKAEADAIDSLIGYDLKKAIETGPSARYPDYGIGRASKWSAEGMMARVWLFYTGFYNKAELPFSNEDGSETGSITKDQVVTWIEDCIQNSGHGLVSDQRNLWPYTNPYTGKDYPYVSENGLDWVGDENIESMFAVKMSNKGSYDGGYGGQIRHNRIVEYYNPRKTDARSFPFSVIGYSNGPVCEKLWTDWGSDPDYAGDYRRQGSICKRADEIPNYPGDPAKEVENTDLLAKKYLGVGAYDTDGTLRQSYGYFYGSNNNHQTGLTQSLVWLRFADVLLMHSELTDGKTIFNGKSGLNAVRARAGLPDLTYSLANLKKERRYELCFEAVRWNDLRRWGDVSEIVKNQQGNNILNEGKPGTYQFSNDFMGRYTATGGGFYKIPSSQITLADGVLEQNPGWGDEGNWAKGDLPYFKH